MNIERLELKNFRNFEAAVFEFPERRTLIAGPNGIGKSTILDAIEWVLTGQCRGVDGRGVGAKDLIRTGASSASVTVTVDGLAITRAVDEGGVTGSAKPDAILQRLGVPAPMLRAVLNSATFFDLDHKAAKDLLFGLLNVQVLPDDIPELKLKKPIGLDELKLRYDAAFSNRATAKRILSALVIPDLPKVADLADGQVADLVAVRAAREAAKLAAGVARDAWTMKRSRLQSVGDELESTTKALAQVDSWKASKSAHEAMLRDLQAARAAIVQPALDEDPDVERKSLAALQTEKRDAEQVIARVKAHADAEGAGVAQGHCVLSRDIPCLTPSAEFAGHVKTVTKLIRSLEKAIKAAEAEGGVRAKHDAEVRENDRQVQYHRSQIEQMQARIETAEQSRARVADLKAEHEGLTEDLPDFETRATETMQADAEAERRLAAAVAYDAALAARRQALDRKVMAEKEVADLEALVERLGPKGVQVAVLKRSVGEFEAAINAAMEGFGFKLAIQPDPWAIMVNGRRYALLSGAEKLMVGTAFAQALAMVSGLEFVAIDASEVAVGEHRFALTALVMEGPVGQVLIAMAKDAGEPVPTNIEGLTVIQPHLIPSRVV